MCGQTAQAPHFVKLPQAATSRKFLSPSFSSIYGIKHPVQKIVEIGLCCSSQFQAIQSIIEGESRQQKPISRHTTLSLEQRERCTRMPSCVPVLSFISSLLQVSLGNGATQSGLGLHTSIHLR